jgi:hypothetical protein
MGVRAREGRVSANTPLAERVYYRSTLNGQRGYLVETEMGERIRHDNPHEAKIVKFTQDWQPEAVRPPLNRMQVARVAYAADRVLAMWLGDPVDIRKDWMSIDDEERITFMKCGPAATGKRLDCFLAIMESLECNEN